MKPNQNKSGLLKQNSSEYEHYEDDLNEYRDRSSKQKLQAWKMIQSQFIAQTAHKKEANKYDLLPGTYSHKITEDFSQKQSQMKTSEELKSELKEMRKMLYDLNELVNQKLNKYELVEIARKGMMNVNEPEKEEQILKATIETNHKVIDALEKEIEQLIRKDKELEERDYLIELEEKTNEILRFISGKKKEAHDEGVIVEKLDAKLIEMREAEIEGEFKEIKVLKHQIVYYFKKFHENNAFIEDLDKKIQSYHQKDKELSQKFEQLTKIAETKNLLVKANKNYVQNKKVRDELIEEESRAKKKIELFAFSNQIGIEKLEREINKMKKDLEMMEGKIEDNGRNSEEYSKMADQLIDKYHIGSGQTKSLSYRFAETLLKDKAEKTPRKVTPDVILAPRKPQISHPYLKPSKMKVRSKEDKQLNKINRSEQVAGRYDTLDSDLKKSVEINDKNHQTIDFEEPKSNKFRIKPNINIRKRNNASQEVNMESLESPDRFKNQSSLFKPQKFNKLTDRRNKKTVPVGPLSDDYMKKLQEKGRKNLEGV